MKTESHRCKGMVWIDQKRNYRVYYDLDRTEANWLRRIATHFNLTIDAFLAAYYGHSSQVRRPAFARPDFASFKVSCSDPAIWRKLNAIAKYKKHKGGAERQCIGSILGELEMWNDDVLFSPKTGQVLCEREEINALIFRTNLARKPVSRREGRTARGFAMEPLNAATAASEYEDAACPNVRTQRT